MNGKYTDFLMIPEPSFHGNTVMHLIKTERPNAFTDTTKRKEKRLYIPPMLPIWLC